MVIKNSILFWILTTITSAFFAFAGIVWFSEWWSVEINNDISGYPWGNTNEGIWFYENPQLYANVIFAEAVLISIPTIITVASIITRKKMRTLYSLLGCSVAFIIILINGSIQN